MMKELIGNGLRRFLGVLVGAYPCESPGISSHAADACDYSDIMLLAQKNNLAGSSRCVLSAREIPND